MSSMQSDEAYARQLQDQELGVIHPHTPLIQNNEDQYLYTSNNAQDQQRRSPTFTINARISESNSQRIALFAILIITLPQIIASFVVLSHHWSDVNVCDDQHTLKWKLWSLLSATRMLSYDAIVVVMYNCKTWLQERPQLNRKLTNLRNSIDAVGLVWFVIGNMWLFNGDDPSLIPCKHPEKSPIYQLCLSMIIINYVQICLPCIIAALMIPIFCFCMPFMIRFLARMQNLRATEGATETSIASIPLITIGSPDSNMLLTPESDSTCPICLNDLIDGDEARLLNCKHIFHRNCVDEWLRVNSSCPTCRKSILEVQSNNDPLLGQPPSSSSSSSTTLAV